MRVSAGAAAIRLCS